MEGRRGGAAAGGSGAHRCHLPIMWVEKLAALKASAIVPNLGGRHERCEF